MTWANVVKDQGKAKQLVPQREDQVSFQTQTVAMTSPNVVKGVVKGKAKAKHPVISREDQASSETPAPTMTSANVVKGEEEVK